MSKSSRAKGFLGGLFGSKEEMEEVIGDASGEEVDPNAPREEFIVYYIGDRPDCVWQYYHNPTDGMDILDDHGKATGQRKGYGRQYGYWDEDKDPDAKVARHFVENKSTNLKLMDFNTFMDRVVPNRDCTKIFETEADFLLELI
jgi:hypothetical protein